MRNGVPCGRVCADSANDVGTPRSVASKVMAQPLSVRAKATRPTRVTRWITNLPGKKRGAPHDGGAPQSYCVLHADGSLERDVRSDAEDAGGPAAVELLGVVCHMEPQHSESYIGAQDPADIRHGGQPRRLVPAVRNGEVRLDAEPWGPP